MNYDAGDYAASLDAAIKAADYNGFPARKAAAAKNGKLRGIGMSCYIEACGLAPSCRGRLARRRRRPVGIGRGAGQRRRHHRGADRLAQPRPGPRDDLRPAGQPALRRAARQRVDRARRHRQGADGHGHLWLALRRGRHVGAIAKALDKVEAKAKKIAAHLLEADEGDIIIEDGTLKVAGTDKQVPWFQVALAAYTAHNLPAGMEPGLKETSFYDPSNFTFPAGCYICEVEIDPDTGQTDIVQFVAADDFGNIINPMIVEGQVHGGIAQGIGQALLEGAYYDATGQLITASYMDYTMPRASDLPSFQVSTSNTPCPSNPLGIKGCGEAGAIGSPPAVMNAITDAIGDNDITMPATASKVWATLKAATKH